jgi:hypothetical protein
MIKISYWAKHRPAEARITIIVLHIILTGLAIYVGSGLNEFGILMPAKSLYILVPIFLLIAFFYPSRNKKTGQPGRIQFYRTQKTFDFLAAAMSFTMVCFVANNYHSNNISATVSATNIALPKDAGAKPTAEQILASLSYRDKNTLTRLEKRILKTEFKHQLKVYVKAKLTRDDETAAKAVLIILSVIGAVGLTFLLAALACNIACNGSEAAAIIVSILGLAAIIFLLVYTIKKIKNHNKTVTEESPATKNKG